MTANIHYNSNTTLEKREKYNCPVDVWSVQNRPTQIAEEVGLSPQTASSIVKVFVDFSFRLVYVEK